MRAITISQPGGPEVLQWTEVPDPEPGPGEVVIDIAATAVNRADLLQRQGHYPPPPGAPPYPGLECAGRIAALGPDVTDWAVGDEVAALLAGGGYAEQVAVPAGHVLPRPPTLSLIEAGGFAEVACTVWSNVFMIAGLRPGELFLVHGGASGIGTTAIQLAKAAGARVAVTAGTPEKLERCRELGADIAINYRTEDFVEVLTEAGGADVILDNMGAQYLARNIEALAPNGRLVIIGMQGGLKAELNIGALLGKRGAVMATTLRARPVEEKSAIVAAVAQHVLPLLDKGEFRLIVDRTLPITQAAQAHRVVEASDHVGKVLLEVGR